jgi:DNA-binding CsgD family transcriptional regulator
MMGLTRQEKEKLVLDLRSQGKTFRQIAKEAQISPRDIKDILNKKAGSEEQSLSISSQAYQLFSQGKTPLEVAIALNLREEDATQYYKEYWNLKHLYNLNQVYEEVKDDGIQHFLSLYKSAKAAGMGIQQVISLLKIANNHLPAVEYRLQELRKEKASLEAGNRNSAILFQDLNDQVITTQKAWTVIMYPVKN